MRILWMTDLHLDFVSAAQVSEFLAQAAAQRPDAVLVGGDMGQSHNFDLYLAEMADAFSCPVYFVLGNHDFYGSSIAAVRARAAALANGSKLGWLTRAGIVKLSAHTGLIGHDGWADGRLGSYATSSVMLNDYVLIEELARLDPAARLKVLNRLGDEAAAHLGRVLPAALARFGHVILLTHAPPFRAACWHEGRISNEEWLPHMTCQAVGEVLTMIMRQHPQKQLTVLCGHTHSSGEARPLKNVRVLTGGAVYGSPAVTQILELV